MATGLGAWMEWNTTNASVTSSNSCTSTSSDGIVWYNWNLNSASGVLKASTTVTNGAVWQTWTTSDTTITSGTCNVVWANWNETIGQLNIDPQLQPQIQPSYLHSHVPLLSEEEKQRLELRRQQGELKIKLANERANRLLFNHLTPGQLEDLKQNGGFNVMLENGREYRIEWGSHGNVFLLGEASKKMSSYCIQPRGQLPKADSMLAQKLLLEANEDQFLRIANESRMYN